MPLALINAMEIPPFMDLFAYLSLRCVTEPLIVRKMMTSYIAVSTHVNLLYHLRNVFIRLHAAEGQPLHLSRFDNKFI